MPVVSVQDIVLTPPSDVSLSVYNCLEIVPQPSFTSMKCVFLVLDWLLHECCKMMF